MTEVLEDVVQWATQCGLRGEIKVEQPQEITVMDSLCGWRVTVKETQPPRRIGTARYNAAGRRSMWTLDGRGVR